VESFGDNLKDLLIFYLSVFFEGIFIGLKFFLKTSVNYYPLEGISKIQNLGKNLNRLLKKFFFWFFTSFS
jgi:uncharacterized membrane protein